MAIFPGDGGILQGPVDPIVSAQRDARPPLLVADPRGRPADLLQHAPPIRSSPPYGYLKITIFVRALGKR